MFFRNCRIIFTAIKNIIAGSQTQIISLRITSKPRSLKNLMPIGETSIGRHGKKYRSLLKGASNATPEPPLVNISSNGCENVMSAQ